MQIAHNGRTVVVETRDLVRLNGRPDLTRGFVYAAEQIVKGFTLEGIKETVEGDEPNQERVATFTLSGRDQFDL